MKRRLEDAKSKINNKQLFSSSSFRGYLADMAEATSGRYKKPLKIKLDWDSKSGEAAYTDGNLVYINAANRLTKGLPTRQLKARSLIGLLAHEIGHVLFTNFKHLEKFVTKLESGAFWPVLPTPTDTLEDIALGEIVSDVFEEKDEKKKKRALTLIARIAKDILNILEDVYSENRMCHKFPGTFKSGIELIDSQIIEHSQALTDIVDNKDAKPISIMLSLLLQYVRSGDIYNPDGLENEYTETLDRCLGYIDSSLYSEDEHARHNTTNTLVLNLWPFIKKELDNIEDEKGGEKEGEEKEGDGSGSGDKSSSPSKGAGGAPRKDDDKADKALEELLKEIGKISEDAGATVQPKGKNEPVPSKVIGKGPGKPGDGSDVKSDTIGTADADDDIRAQKVVEEEGGRIPFEETEAFESKGDGSVERDSSYEGSGYDSADEDIERILDAMAEERLHAGLEKELTQELQDLANDISYGNAHLGVGIRINRMSAINDGLIEAYNRISAPLLLTSKRLQKQVAQALRDRRDGGKLTGLVFGKRFSVRDIVRGDGRCFYNNRLPSDPLEMAVAVLVDESGSMGSYDRATYARAASIVIYDFCCGLNLPVAVYGHTESSKVEIFAHAEFDAFDKNDKYRMMDISARGNNRDGMALRFVAERMSKRPEPLKILIVISDGQPAGNGGYYGSAAEADVRGVKLEYKRKGVNIFSAAIGNDKENIERIYGDGFLDIADLSKLPKNLCSLLIQHIKLLG